MSAYAGPDDCERQKEESSDVYDAEKEQAFLRRYYEEVWSPAVVGQRL
jgi:hypothetical protein